MCKCFESIVFCEHMSWLLICGTSWEWAELCAHCNSDWWIFSAAVRVLLCVSSVPASCVHIWFVSCPCFMSLWVKYVPAVFVSLSVINLCKLVHACSVWFRLVYSLFPGVSVHVSPALMSTLKTIIWVYVLVCVSLFLPAVCTVTAALWVM